MCILQAVKQTHDMIIQSITVSEIKHKPKGEYTAIFCNIFISKKMYNDPFLIFKCKHPNVHPQHKDLLIILYYSV